MAVRKHPAPEGALRHLLSDPEAKELLCQKAPSTRRCIKTSVDSWFNSSTAVRKHPAPEGALRLQKANPSKAYFEVRKHPAPEGALRLHTLQPVLHTAGGQKAPSTRRPIDGNYSPPSSPLRAERPDGSAEEALPMSHGPDSSTTTPGCARSHRRERRPFGLTSLELVAEGAPGAVGGAWRQDAEKWLNRGGSGRSRGVLAEPVALQSPEVAQRCRSQRQGVRKHPAPEGALRHRP